MKSLQLITQQDWDEYEFADLCDITRGASPRPIHEWISADGIPWIKIADASATQSRTITRTKERIRSEGRTKSVPVWPGDLILSNSATPGIPKFVGIEGCIHDGWLLLRNLRNLDKSFCYYLLLSERPRIVEQGSGTVFTNLKTEILKRHRVKIPPISEQRAIAHILGTLDDKIELNRRMNQTLEEMARALFKSWFVDFDPVRAKMTGRWRPGQSLPGLPAEHYELFPQRLVNSQIGEIPEGWAVKTLAEMVELNPRERMKRGAEAPYLDMASLPTSGPSPNRAISREFKSGSRFRNGDTLFARITPCLENGKTAFVQSLSGDVIGWGSTEFIVMRAISPVPSEYTYLLARDEAFREHAIQSMTGTSGRQRVQVDALAPYLLPFPPINVWARFSSLVDPIFTDIEMTHRESYSLKAQRNALLPMLVSGNIRTVRNHPESDA